jgi:steroid 5-alpha reductase family enzyme
MALPTIRTLEDCADFSMAVRPFIPQLYGLPAKLLDAFSGRESLLQLYTETNPLVSGFAISVFLGAVFLVAAEINRNYSQVDRFWSLLPTLYIAHFDVWARLAGLPSQRVDAALFCSAVWSIRLTFNYWRKGGYGIGHEDYRWEVIRQHVPKAVFHVFNWTFISFIQSILLFMIAAPVYTILLASTIDPDVTSADIAAAAVQLGLVLTEYIADEQQWVYQSAKKQYKDTGKVTRGFTQADLDRGFITTGLWGYSRHPNFAAEQTIWFVLYQWSCYASKTLYNWAGAGPAFLVLLFQGSTWFTELITAGKYAGYRDYQQRVGMFAPSALSAYRSSPAARVPKVIRTSELEKKLREKEKNQKQK